MEKVPKAIEEITQQDFLDYEDVRQGGRWNMLSPQARLASGLDESTYSGVIRYYTELRKKFMEPKTGELI